MKLSDIILAEGVNPRELDKYIEELVQLLKDGKEVQVPAGGGAINIVSQDKAIRFFLLDRIRTYIREKGDALAGIEGIKTDPFHKVPYLAFKLSDEEIKARKDYDQGMRDFIAGQRAAGHSTD